MSAPYDEPKRPWSIWAAWACFHASAAAVVAGLLWGFWLSVREFDRAALLHRLLGDIKVPADQVPLVKVGIVTGLFAIAMIICTAQVIAGRYGFEGYRWTRWAGIIAAVVAGAAILMNEIAWAAVPLAVLGAIALWLPPSNRFFAAWHALRHPEPAYPTIVDNVVYGEIPRFGGSTPVSGVS